MEQRLLIRYRLIRRHLTEAQTYYIGSGSVYESLNVAVLKILLSRSQKYSKYVYAMG